MTKKYHECWACSKRYLQPEGVALMQVAIAHRLFHVFGEYPSDNDVLTCACGSLTEFREYETCNKCGNEIPVGGNPCECANNLGIVQIVFPNGTSSQGTKVFCGGKEMRWVSEVKIVAEAGAFITAEITTAAVAVDEVWAYPFMSEENFIKAAKRYGYKVEKETK